MVISDNNILKMACDLASSYESLSPNAIVFGVAKILCMSDNSRRAIFSTNEIAEIKQAGDVFDSFGLDPNLIKNGLPVLFQRGKLTDATFAVKTAEIREFISKKEYVSAAEAVTISLNAFPSDILKLFEKGKSLSDIMNFSCQDEQSEPKTPRPKVVNYIKDPAKEPEKETESKPETPAKSEPVKAQTTPSPFDNKGSLFDLKDKYRNLTLALLDRLKGQDPAIIKFVEGCFQGEVFSKMEEKEAPLAYFFFFGPPGTGKTTLAKTAARYLGRPFKAFSMSEYSEEKAHIDLIGGNPNFKNAEAGILVDYVDKHPNAVILFDEIEKAHDVVIKLFLQILSEGVLGNAFTKKNSNFKDTILIFTSNVGSDLYEERETNLTTLPDRVIIDAIRNQKKYDGERPAFPPELISRLSAGNVIMFNHLGVNIISEIARISFEEATNYLSGIYGCSFTYDVEVPMLFLANRGTDIDARVASQQSMNFVKKEFYELLRQTRASHEKNPIRNVKMETDFTGATQEIQDLFHHSGNKKIILLSDEKVKTQFNISNGIAEVLWTSSTDEAKEMICDDIVALFIDPMLGFQGADSKILSVTDYASDGIDFFHRICEVQTGLPVYILDVNKTFVEADVLTFAREGARGVIAVDNSKEIESILLEIDMERKNVSFNQQGWIVNYNTRQEIDDNGDVKIVFYDLRKGRAVEVDSRGTVLNDIERPVTKFDDVVGATYAKEELRYFIEYLKDPKAFLLAGGSKPPKGVLLYGSPGTGKTMLARAMAGESDVTFIATSASEFQSMYHGGGEENIRNIFKRARKYAPSIVFIDEIDAIGKRRTGSSNTATTESMLNALLVEIDGFNGDNRHPVFVLAATNYGVGSDFEGIDTLDPALLRRFDNKIEVELPNKAERLEYITRVVNKKKLDKVSTSVINNLAERSNGSSLSTIQNVLELAVRNAIRAKKPVTDEDILEAWEQERFGVQRESTPEHMKVTAVHEAGHAIVNYLSGECPSHITIHGRKGLGGYMEHAHDETIMTRTKDDILGRIRTSLAGRAAEMVVFGGNESVNSGASSDLKHATYYAHKLYCQYCMDEGNLVVLSWDEMIKSPAAESYLSRINEILQKQMDYTVSLITDNIDMLKRVSDTLFDKGQLTGDEFKALVEK